MSRYRIRYNTYDENGIRELIDREIECAHVSMQRQNGFLYE